MMKYQDVPSEFEIPCSKFDISFETIFEFDGKSNR